MIEYNKIDECLRTIFAPEYEKGRHKISAETDQIVFSFERLYEIERWNVTVLGFENKVYSSPLIVDDKEIIEIFEDCFICFLNSNNGKEVEFSLYFLEHNLILNKESFGVDEAVQSLKTIMNLLDEKK